MKRVTTLLLKFLAIITIIVLGAAYFLYEADIPAATLKAKYINKASAFVEVDGMQVHYRVEGNGFPLVLVHGTGAMLQTWDVWTELLKPHYKIVRMDLPAFGLTGPHPQGEYHIEDYVSFMRDFLKAAKIDSCYMAGNSLGGLIAWQYAIAEPQQVKKLVLLDPAGFHFHREGTGSMVFNLSKKYPRLTKRLVNFGTSRLVKKTLGEVYYDDALITPALVDMYSDISKYPGNRAAFVDRVKIEQNFDTLSLKKIQCPSLILWGKEDVLINVAEAQYFKHIPNSTFIYYDMVGHVPQEEIPKQSAEDTHQFLGKL